MSFLTLIDHALGRCPRCMRKSFAAALGICAVAFVLAAFGAPRPIVTAVSVGAVSASGLWLAHVIAFALRASLPAPRAPEKPPAPAGSVRSRREIALEFARAAAFIALATAISSKAALACTQLPKACSANDDCECSKCCGDLSGIHVCQPSC